MKKHYKELIAQKPERLDSQIRQNYRLQHDQEPLLYHQDLIQYGAILCWFCKADLKKEREVK